MGRVYSQCVSQVFKDWEIAMKVGSQAELIRVFSMAVFLGVGLIGSAWGQALYSTDSGCKLYLNPPNVEQPVQWSGGCSQGLAQGPGILSFQFDAGAQGGGRYHSLDYLEKGRPSGVGLYVEDAASRGSRSSPFNLRIVLYREGVSKKRNSLPPDIQWTEAEALLAAYFEQALAEGLPTTPLAQLRTALRTWKENPKFDPVAWGAVPPGGTRFTGSAPKQTDDPKVVGRGARGG